MCVYASVFMVFFFFFKQKTAYEMRISDWSSDVCSSDLLRHVLRAGAAAPPVEAVPGRLLRHLGGLLEEVVGHVEVHGARPSAGQIGRASCRERVCQYV